MQEDYDYDTLISKQIAKELGLSRDSVRGYCKRNGLDRNSKLTKSKGVTQYEI